MPKATVTTQDTAQKHQNFPIFLITIAGLVVTTALIYVTIGLILKIQQLISDARYAESLRVEPPRPRRSCFPGGFRVKSLSYR